MASAHLNSCTVDLDRGLVHGGPGDGERLTTKELELLRYLVDRTGKDVTRDDLLHDVWGYTAGNERVVDTAMRRLRVKVEREPREPAHLLTVFGSGYRFVPATAPAAVPNAPPRGDGPTATASLVPREMVHLVGRESTVESALEALDASAVVSLVGPGGAGKTTLCIHLLHRRLEAGAQVRFCDLAQARDTDGVVRAVATGLGVTLPDLEPQVQLEAALQAAGPLLLVLDNVEQVVTDAAQLVAGWLEVASHARFLVTSRERLGLRSEVVIPVGPLSSEDAVALFRQRALAVWPDWDERDRDDLLTRLVDELDRLPLAIELAASRVRGLSLEQLLEQLGLRFRLLRSKDRDRPERHQRLWAAVQWSWELLHPEEQRALVELSVFRGGFDQDAVELVVQPEDPDVYGEDLLLALVDKSLVQVALVVRGQRRFRPFVTVAAFIDEKCQEDPWPPIVALARRRHLELMAKKGQDASLRRLWGPREGHLLEELEVERHNLEAAASTARGTGDSLALAQCALALSASYLRTGPTTRALELVAAALSCEGVPEDLQARLLVARSEAESRQGDRDLARASADRAVTLATSLGTRAEAHLHLASLLRGRRDTEGALRSLDAARLAAIEADLPAIEGLATMGIATLRARGQAADRSMLDSARDAVQRSGCPSACARVLARLAFEQVRHGNSDEAEALFERALASWDEAKRPHGQTPLGRVGAEDIKGRGYAYTQLGTVLTELGDRDAARTAIEAGVDLLGQARQRLREGWAQTTIGEEVLHEADDAELARGQLQVAARVHESTGQTQGWIASTIGLLALAVAQADWEGARELDRALEAADAKAPTPGLEDVLVVARVRLDLATGQTGRALRRVDALGPRVPFTAALCRGFIAHARGDAEGWRRACAEARTLGGAGRPLRPSQKAALEELLQLHA